MNGRQLVKVQFPNHGLNDRVLRVSGLEADAELRFVLHRAFPGVEALDSVSLRTGCQLAFDQCAGVVDGGRP